MNNYKIGSEHYHDDNKNNDISEDYICLFQSYKDKLNNVYFMTIINLLFNIMFFFTLVYLSFYVPEIRDRLNELYEKLNNVDINNLLAIINNLDDNIGDIDNLNVNEIKQTLIYLLGNISHIEKRLHF